MVAVSGDGTVEVACTVHGTVEEAQYGALESRQGAVDHVRERIREATGAAQIFFMAILNLFR